MKKEEERKKRRWPRSGRRVASDWRMQSAGLSALCQIVIWKRDLAKLGWHFCQAPSRHWDHWSNKGPTNRVNLVAIIRFTSWTLWRLSSVKPKIQNKAHRRKWTKSFDGPKGQNVLSGPPSPIVMEDKPRFQVTSTRTLYIFFQKRKKGKKLKAIAFANMTVRIHFLL